MEPDYKEDEIVMAEDKGNIYVAKIVKFSQTGDSFQYFIHYQGWARKYDVWVQADQICKSDDEDAKIKLQLYSQSKNPKLPTKEKVSRTKQNSANSSFDNFADLMDDDTAKPSNKRKSNAELEEEARELKRNRTMLSNSDLVQEDDADMATAQRLEIPMNLKKHLLDEWSLISQQDPRRLVKLPRKVTAEMALRDFVATLDDKLDDEQLDSHRDFYEGVQLYFEKALPTVLLYRHEREQYDEVSKTYSDLVPSQIYGTEHLLRLFVRIPKLMSGVFLPPSETNKVYTKFSQFLKFIGKNASKYLSIEEYVLEDEAMSAGAAEGSGNDSATKAV